MAPTWTPFLGALMAAPLYSALNKPGKMPDRRRFARVRVNVLGRFMLPNQQEFPCQVIDMSPGGVAIATPIAGKIGDRIIVYLDHMGRVEGHVARIFEGGFAMTIQASSRKREKLANQLTWLANRQSLGLPEDRRHKRLAPKTVQHAISIDGGMMQSAIVMDVSQSGAGIKAMNKPAIGTRVVLAEFNGVVVRHFEGGFAIEFTPMQSDEKIARVFF